MISKSQIRKAIQKGGSLFSAIMPMLGRVLPYASKIAGPLLTRALSGLSSLGVNKLFGSGQRQAKGGFLIQPGVVTQLMLHIGQFTTVQQKNILKASQAGSGLVLKPTPSQRGGFIGSLLASIGIPLFVNALTGKGLQVDPSSVPRGWRLQIDPPGYYHRPRPFYGAWEQ